jgi:hypothetical protein
MAVIVIFQFVGNCQNKELKGMKGIFSPDG